MLTATVGVQPPILDTFPGEAEEVHNSLSKKSNLNYSILKKETPTKLFFFFWSKQESTKNKQILNSE